MARPATGQVVERTGKAGRSVALRFHAYGKRRYLTLPVGTSRDAAEEELRNVLADVRRGIWQPAGPAPAPEPTFHEFASEWFEQRRHEVRPSTVEAVQWRLSYVLLPFFASHRLSQITPREVDRYRQAQVQARDRLRTLRDTQAALPVAERERLSRPLSNSTINRTIALLGQILELAVEYDLIAANPARGRRRLLKADKPSRAYLDSAGQIAALLDAARELDAEARDDRRHVARRPLLATLTFAGLRIGELLELRWRDVDLAGGWLTVSDAKTDAGVRKVKIRPALRDELLAYKAGTTHDGAAAFVFGTSEGKRQSAGNVRVRVLAKALERADEHLAERHEPPLPAVTPHGLRRSFASILYALGEPPPVVMAEMGHTDPALALAIYAQAMRRHAGDNSTLRELVLGPSSDEVAPAEARLARVGTG